MLLRLLARAHRLVRRQPCAALTPTSYACVYSRDFAGVPPACAPSQTWASPALKALPKLARLGQSLRRYHDKNGLPSLQLTDAAKFALGIVQCFVYAAWRISGETKAWRIAYIVISVTDSIANAVWDVTADWNLGSPKRASCARVLD